jgi:hypothetical protein
MLNIVTSGKDWKNISKFFTGKRLGKITKNIGGLPTHHRTNFIF